MSKFQFRFCLSILGTVFTGISVGLFKAAVLGVDPFQCFVMGLNNVISLDFGTLYVLINLILFIIVLILDKTFIGISTFLNLFLLGYIIDFIHKVVISILPTNLLLVKISLLIVGFIMLCFSSSLYITANLGVSTYDALSLIAAKRNIAPFKYCRITSDFISVIVGVLLGATAGIGTVMTAFLMGPLISFFNEKFTVPLLEKFN